MIEKFFGMVAELFHTNGGLLFAALAGGFLAMWWTVKFSIRGLDSATNDMASAEKSGSDIRKVALLQTRHDIASIVFVLGVTNGLLGAILAALLFR